MLCDDIFSKINMDFIDLQLSSLENTPLFSDNLIDLLVSCRIIAFAGIGV
jgi:hypothetical protein